MNSPMGPRRPARISEIALAPPTAGTLWQTAQLVPLNAGPSPSAAFSTSRKSSSPRRNSSNSIGVIPGSGSPGADVRVWATRKVPASTTSPPPSNNRKDFTISLRDDDAAHELVTRAAQLRALERVPAGSRLEGHCLHAAATFGQLEIDVGSDDPEAVSRVLAAQTNLETCARLHADLRWREAESLRGNLDDLPGALALCRDIAGCGRSDDHHARDDATEN